MRQLSDAVAAAWAAGADRDWSTQAGTVEWTCSRTAAHAVDCVFAPALFLASRKIDGYPAYGDFSPGDDADPSVYVEALHTATRILCGVVESTPDDARAVIWRRPAVEVRGREDFPPRAALELALHAHDVCSGLGIEFAPSDQVAEHLRAHTADWPFWSGSWEPVRSTGDAWAALLRASGRLH